MKKILAVMAALAMMMLGLQAMPASAATLPAGCGTIVHGMTPLGYYPQGNSTSIYYYGALYKEGAELNQWCGTTGAVCMNLGADNFNDPALNDGIPRWLCEEHLDFWNNWPPPAGTPATKFYDSLFGWFHGLSGNTNCSLTTCFRISTSPATHKTIVDAVITPRPS